MPRFRLMALFSIYIFSLIWLFHSTPGWAEEQSAEEIRDFDEISLETLMEMPDVEAASFRKQNLMLAPASVSVISQREIENLGVSTLPEILRRVTGIHVLQTGANSYSIGLRGVNSLINNRILVLINGRQVRDEFWGYLPWSALPIHVGDIERIEVIRGPGSTLYGRDALSGVVNVITKHPLDHVGWESLAVAHTNFLKGDTTKSYQLQNGGGGYLAANWANQSRTVGGRVSISVAQFPEWETTYVKFIHGPFQYSLMGSLDIRPDSDLTWFTTISHTQSEGIYLSSYPNIAMDQLYAKNAVTTQLAKKGLFLPELTLKAEADVRWLTREAQSSATAGDSGVFSLARATHEMEEQFSSHGVVLLDFDLFHGRNPIIIGGEASTFHLMNSSSGIFNYFLALLVSSETHLSFDPPLILSLDARWEYSRVHGDWAGDVAQQNLSPRVGLIWQPAENHTLRLTGATSYRSPNPDELFNNQMLKEPEPPVPKVFQVVGNPALDPEKLYSVEAGYRSVLFNLLQLDATAYWQYFDGLIQYMHQTVMPNYRINTDPIQHFGLELSLRIVPSPQFNLIANYTFTYEWGGEDAPADESSGEDLSRDQGNNFPMHLGFLGLEWSPGYQLTLRLDCTLVFGYRPMVEYLKNYRQGSGLPYFLWNASEASDQVIIDLQLSRKMFNGSAEVYLLLKNLGGFFRDRNELRMTPSEEAQPIGGAVLLGLRMQGS